MTRLTFLAVLFLSSLLVYAETTSFWTRIAPFQALFQTILPPKPASPPVRHAGLILPSEVFYKLDGVSYMTPTHLPITTLTLQQRWEAREAFSVLTVIPLPEKGKQVTDRQISSILDEFAATDDVFAGPWLETVLLTPTPTKTPSKLSQRAVDALISRGTRTLLVPPSITLSISNETDTRLTIIRLTAPVPSGLDLRGPYLVRSSGNPTFLDLYDVYRLYADIYRTFILGMYPLNDGSGRFASVRQYDSQGYLQIPVPSKLRGQTGNSVMAGARIGVKDNFHIAGLPTAAGNRAYGEMYGDRNETASTVQKVIDLGGVLVGKTKTSQFTTGASTSDETIDEQYPWSPRADGYQSCGASSSGSACAVAAYDWLDFALGSDTGGSMRVPGALTGVYANRPSFGSMPLDGIMPLSDPYDTVGLFTRSPTLFAEFIKSWYNNSSTELKRYPELPHKILIDPSWIIQETTEAQALIDGFLIALGSQLDMQISNISLDSLLSAEGWDASYVETIMLDGMFQTITYHTWKSFGHELLTRHRAENEGRWPMLDTQNNRWWTWAEEKGYQKEIEEFESRETEDAVVGQFASWINEKFLGSNDRSCSDSIFIYDIGTGGFPSYRSKALNVPGQGIPTYSNHRNNTLTSSYLCPLAQCVDYTVPIGQVPYLSAVSKRVEMMPVTVSLVARKGCDFMLADFVEKLAEKKLIAEVKSGREAF